jgi:hypothetical protein
LDDWEERHGKLTEQELARAAKELAPSVKSPRKWVLSCSMPVPLLQWKIMTARW